MACNISNLARHTCISSIDLTNFYKRHSIYFFIDWFLKFWPNRELHSCTGSLWSMTLVSISEYHFPATLSYNKCCIRCGNKGVPTRFLKHLTISKTHFNLNGSNLASRDHIPVSLENNINFDPQGRNSHLRWSYIVNIWLQSNNICLFSNSNSIVYHG